MPEIANRTLLSSSKVTCDRSSTTCWTVAHAASATWNRESTTRRSFSCQASRLRCRSLGQRDAHEQERLARRRKNAPLMEEEPAETSISRGPSRRPDVREMQQADCHKVRDENRQTRRAVPHLREAGEEGWKGWSDS